MSAKSHRPYPLTFQPILKHKAWGGSRLRGLGKPANPGDSIGESWELADLATTSVSGGGGAAQRSVITNGPLAGSTITDALAQWGDDLLGPAKPAADGGFPLLVKYLDAREHLSVQVHPSPDYAAAHPQAHLKTECWYVIEAEPGSVIFAGIKPGVTHEQFAQHISEGTSADDLIAIDAEPGQLHYLPSGTCHALGAGVLVAEVQTPSDTTFRVYDWAKEYGRCGRELHVEQAIECIDFAPAPPPSRLGDDECAARLLATEFFSIDEVRLEMGDEMPVGVAEECSVLMVPKGWGTLIASDGSFEDVELPVGSTVLVPAAVADAATLRTVDPASVLRAQLCSV